MTDEIQLPPPWRRHEDERTTWWLHPCGVNVPQYNLDFMAHDVERQVAFELGRVCGWKFKERAMDRKWSLEKMSRIAARMKK